MKSVKIGDFCTYASPNRNSDPKAALFPRHETAISPNTLRTLMYAPRAPTIVTHHEEVLQHGACGCACGRGGAALRVWVGGRCVRCVLTLPRIPRNMDSRASLAGPPPPPHTANRRPTAYAAATHHSARRREDGVSHRCGLPLARVPRRVRQPACEVGEERVRSGHPIAQRAQLPCRILPRDSKQARWRTQQAAGFHAEDLELNEAAVGRRLKGIERESESECKYVVCRLYRMGLIRCGRAS
jgi:hypothetical protein